MSDFGRIARLAGIFSDERAAAVNSLLAIPDMSEWDAAAVKDEGAFVTLCSRCYTWFVEMWAEDIAFVLQNSGALGANVSRAREFRRLIGVLRTSQQHAEERYPDAHRQAAEWLSAVREGDDAEADWAGSAAALKELCEKALEDLVGAGRAIASDAEAADAWARAVTAGATHDPVAVRAIVAGDLGLRMSTGAQTFVDRQIELKWAQRRSALTAHEDAGAALESVVEQVLVAWRLPRLPGSYMDVLEAVGWDGHQDPVPRLLIAHALAEVAAHRSDEEFLERVRRATNALREAGL